MPKILLYVTAKIICNFCFGILTTMRTELMYMWVNAEQNAYARFGWSLW